MKKNFEKALINYGSQIMTAIFQYALKTERYEDCAIIKALFEKYRRRLSPYCSVASLYESDDGRVSGVFLGDGSVRQDCHNENQRLSCGGTCNGRIPG